MSHKNAVYRVSVTTFDGKTQEASGPLYRPVCREAVKNLQPSDISLIDIETPDSPRDILIDSYAIEVFYHLASLYRF